MNNVTEVVIAGPFTRGRITMNELRRIVDSAGATGTDYDILLEARDGGDYDSWVEWSVVKRIEQSSVEADLVKELNQ
jgi:hypothetical protein